ncbi:MAG TPA: CAP domain-containing protein [Kofleriaceae bacterium]|nr:CAP domain-containing protein [Kofleriaceae bacterium]
MRYRSSDRSDRPEGLRLTALALLSLAACSASRGSGQPSWRQSEHIAGSGARGPITIELAPDSPAARAYNDPRIAPAPRSALADAVIREVERISSELGKPAPAPDGRLYAAARELAEVAPQDAPLVYSLIEFALQRNGIIEPSPHLVVVWGPSDEESLIASLAERLPGILGSSEFARLGVGVARRGGGDEVTVLAFQSSFIETGPIPRRLERNDRLQIQAAIKPPYADPEVFVTREDGNVQRMVLAQAGRNSFRTEFACGTHRGRQQVEITALDQTGATVMANFPVWCGEDPPAAIKVELDADETAPIVSGEEAEQRLARLVNQDREKHGLARLPFDPRLTEVARAHSRAMRESGVVAHISPTTGSAGDRVRAGGIKSSLVLENVARAYGVGEAEEGLMNSPGHRANILSRDATHMGLGVVLGGDVAGSRELFVTQVFIRLPARIDHRQTRESVAAIVKRVRALDEDRELSLVAQELADSVAGGMRPADASEQAGKRLDGKSLPYRKVTTQVSTVADLSAFKPDASLSARSLAAFGLGVAQGDHDVMGEAAIHIVLVFGHR